MITFRSRSARIFWLVQISSEMFDYSSPYEKQRGDENESLCEIYFDKWISFVYRLFERWKELEVRVDEEVRLHSSPVYQLTEEIILSFS